VVGSRLDVRDAWGVREDQIAVGYVGRFSPEKSPLAAARGAPPVRNRSTAWSPFVPVHVVADAASDSRASDLLELHLPTGVRLRVPSGFDRQTLTDVLNALGHGVEAPRC
jgi:hypothetical protein